MISMKPGLRLLAVTLALMLPLSTAQGLEKFTQSGTIEARGLNTFTINEKVYRLNPTVQLISHNPEFQQISDLNKGDYVTLFGKVVGGTFFTDLIYIDVYDEDDE